jgi:hypothetical protein
MERFGRELLLLLGRLRRKVIVIMFVFVFPLDVSFILLFVVLRLGFHLRNVFEEGVQVVFSPGSHELSARELVALQVIDALRHATQPRRECGTDDTASRFPIMVERGRRRK